MSAHYSRHVELLVAAEEAYSQARQLVYDVLPPGALPGSVPLTHSQRNALENLAAAEANLDEYRSDRALVRV